MLNAQLAKMLADGTAKIAAESSGQMNRMDANFFGDGVQGQLACVAAFENVNSSGQPGRLTASARAKCLTCQVSDALPHKGLDNQGRVGIGPLELRVETQGKPNQGAVCDLRRIGEDGRTGAQVS